MLRYVASAPYSVRQNPVQMEVLSPKMLTQKRKYINISEYHI